MMNTWEQIRNQAADDQSLKEALLKYVAETYPDCDACQEHKIDRVVCLQHMDLGNICCQCGVKERAIKEGPGDGVFWCFSCDGNFCRDCSWRGRQWKEMPWCAVNSLDRTLPIGTPLSTLD